MSGMFCKHRCTAKRAIKLPPQYVSYAHTHPPHYNYSKYACGCGTHEKSCACEDLGARRCDVMQMLCMYR